MIIGVCIMRLMLLYRDRLVRDDIRLSLPRQKKCEQYEQSWLRSTQIDFKQGINIGLRELLSCIDDWQSPIALFAANMTRRWPWNGETRTTMVCSKEIKCSRAYTSSYNRLFDSSVRLPPSHLQFLEYWQLQVTTNWRSNTTMYSKSYLQTQRSNIKARSEGRLLGELN